MYCIRIVFHSRTCS